MSSQKQLDKGTQIGVVRHGAKILRYHTLPSLGPQQTVGQHSYSVAAIISILWPTCSKELLLAALFHDTPEQAVGDIPSHVKWANPDLSSSIEEMEQRFLKDNGLYYELTDSEKRMLQMADIIDLILHSHELIFRGDAAYSVPYQRGMNKIMEFQNCPEWVEVAKLLSLPVPSKTELN